MKAVSVRSESEADGEMGTSVKEVGAGLEANSTGSFAPSGGRSGGSIAATRAALETLTRRRNLPC